MAKDNYIARPFSTLEQRVAMRWFRNASFIELIQRRRANNSGEFYVVNGDKPAQAPRQHYHHTPYGGDAA